MVEKLTPKQKLFCEEFARTGNKMQSAITAGYSPKSAAQTACDTLKIPKVIEYMHQLQSQIESDRIAKIKEIQEFYTAVMRGEVKDQFGLESSLDTRLNAARELMKRIERTEQSGADAGGITIINNIPRPENTDGENS